jgi:hypothetical protein
MIVPVPKEWLGESSKDKPKGVDGLTPIFCDNYKTLENSWKKALKWTDGLGHGLGFMLAVVTSTKSVGTQLWGKVFANAGGGKTTLAEAISVARDYIYPKDSITGLFSGYQIDGAGAQDFSMINQINGKTLIIKDADTIIQNPALPQIISQFRALYDRSIRTQFKNKMSRDYEGISTTVLFCGTSSMRQLDSSELGERFLDCVLMEGIDEDLEDEINWRVINRADRNLAMEANGKPENRQDPEMTLAMQLTGGYVTYLRLNAQDLLSQVDGSDDAKQFVMRCGKFVAYMRARPSSTQDEVAEREFSARLVEQHWRLAKCLAVVLNRKEVDKEVLKRVKRVAMDTSRGHTLEIARHLYKSREAGIELGAVALRTNVSDDKTRNLLKFMRQIGMAEIHVPANKVGTRNATKRYRLTEKFRKLYHDVVGREHT